MDKIEEVLTRRVAEIIDRQHLEKRLRAGDKLRIKHGIDPTGPKIHIGRASQFLKLREFQKIGHHIILILGTFTARIGDASDKDSMRPMLSEKQVRENVKDYKKQIGKILDLSKTEIRENSEWLEKLDPLEFIKLSSKFTYAQIVERDLYQKRISERKELGLHEFLYPLMQGYDSVAIKADLEIGGTDQKFNLLVGRDVQRFYNQRPQDIMTLKMALGTDGRKMSTSWGNVINIVDPPNDIYGKIMSLKDELILQYFKLCTDVSLQLIKVMEKDLKTKKVNPMELKKKLAFEIVSMYHGEIPAKNAEKEFEKQFQKREYPTKIPWTPGAIESGKHQISKIMPKLIPTFAGTATISETKRLIKQGGLEFEGERIVDPYVEVDVKGGEIIKAGKRRIYRAKVKK